jgi:diguanylate cyclase (GGDEF)-like protein
MSEAAFGPSPRTGQDDFGSDLKQEPRTVAAGISPFRGIAAIIGSACAILIAGCIAVLFEGRSDLVYLSDRMAANILVLAEQTVKVEISRYDVRLQDIISGFETLSEPGHPVPSVDGLFGGAAERDSTGDIMVVDSSGKILISSRPDVTGVYAKVLPEVLATTQFDANGLGISSVVNARPHKPELALVRRFPTVQPGENLRAVVAMLPMSWIQGVFSQTQLGPHGSVGLLDSNHILLARTPFSPDRICTRIWLHQDLERHAPGQIFHTNQSSRIDGVLRRVSATRVGGTPLYVFVGLAMQDIFRGWRVVAMVLLASVVFLTAVIVALTVAVLRQLRRKMQTDRQLVELNTQLEQLARTDPLTGLLNRRGFDENLAREWRRCRRSAKPISLLMLDADFFKQYNDHYGHQAGDAVLRQLARCIAQNIRRPGDIAARYGGEEFAVVLPDTNSVGATHVAENIVAALASSAIDHAPSRSFVTVSIGIGFAEPGSHGGADDLLAVADAALYESKTSGRNRITLRAFTLPPDAAPGPS